MHEKSTRTCGVGVSIVRGAYFCFTYYIPLLDYYGAMGVTRFGELVVYHILCL
jgi:hypothetical protein